MSRRPDESGLHFGMSNEDLLNILNSTIDHPDLQQAYLQHIQELQQQQGQHGYNSDSSAQLLIQQTRQGLQGMQARQGGMQPMQPMQGIQGMHGQHPSVKMEHNPTGYNASTSSTMFMSPQFANPSYNYTQNQHSRMQQTSMSPMSPMSPIPSMSPMLQTNVPIQPQMQPMQPQVINHPQSPDSLMNFQLPSQLTNLLSEIRSVPTQSVLDAIFHVHRIVREHTEKIRQVQKQVLCQPQNTTFEILDSQHKVMKRHVDLMIKSVQSLFCERILRPAEIHQLYLSLQELRLLEAQLDIYHQELYQLTQSHPLKCITTLHILQQPFPMVVTKGKQLEDDPIIVQLLAGANVEFQSFSKMQVITVWESASQSKSNTQKNIECDFQSLDTFRKTAKWNLKFLNGTRKNLISLRFGIQVQVHGPGNAPLTVESPKTKSFIVITNECQWEEAEGTMMKLDAFEGQPKVPWCQFANVLQKHFLRATRQDPSQPTRFLSEEDISYIHSKFFGGHAFITTKEYEQFYAWFGKVMKKLRYQRHILPLWLAGLIHGFMSRDTVHQLLDKQDVGTFLVRFSERHPGQFAIAYRIDEGNPEERIRHYLMGPDDTAGNKKTLPDFLNEHMSFCYMLQIGQLDDGGNLLYKKYFKQSVLEPYLSKRSILTASSGYDTVVHSLTSGGSVEMDEDILDAE